VGQRPRWAGGRLLASFLFVSALRVGAPPPSWRKLPGTICRWIYEPDRRGGARCSPGAQPAVKCYSTTR